MCSLKSFLFENTTLKSRTQQEQQLFFFISHYEPPSILNDECLVTGAGSTVRTTI